MERKDRISKVITHLRLTYTSFAIKCGINPSGLKRMLEGNSSVTDKTLFRITDTFPQINLDWLKTGEGEMLNPVRHSAYQQGGKNNNQQGDGNCYNSSDVIAKLVDDLIDQRKDFLRQLEAKDTQLAAKDTQIADLMSIIKQK